MCFAIVSLKSVIDQWVLAHAEVFFGSPMSSLTGGVMNLRMKLGRPNNRAWFLDNLGRELNAKMRVSNP